MPKAPPNTINGTRRARKRPERPEHGEPSPEPVAPLAGAHGNEPPRVVPLQPQRSGAWAARLSGWRVIRQTPDGDYAHLPAPDGQPNWPWDVTREDLVAFGGVLYAYPIRDDGRQWGPPVGPIGANAGGLGGDRSALESAIGDEFSVFLAEFPDPQERLLFAILQKYHNVTVQLLKAQNRWQAELYERHVAEIKAAHLRCDRIAGGYVEALAASHGVDAALQSSKVYRKLINAAQEDAEGDEVEAELRSLFGGPLKDRVREAMGSELRGAGLLPGGPAVGGSSGVIGPPPAGR